MNFRKRSAPAPMGFQIAPMVDVLLVLLIFFIATWKVAMNENELDVKVPSAANSTEQKPDFNQVVLNIKKDGSVVFNKKPMGAAELRSKLSELASLYPDQAVIVRGDEQLPYQGLVDVLDICRQANIWNLIFATAPTQSAQR